MINKETLQPEKAIESISSEKLFKMTRGVKTFLKQSGLKECEISFDFIIMSLFPTVYDKIRMSIDGSYLNGWNEGRAALVNERRVDLDTEGISN